jgi:hypothetical protein
MEFGSPLGSRRGDQSLFALWAARVVHDCHSRFANTYVWSPDKENQKLLM